MALVFFATVFDAAGVHSLAFYLLLSAIPAIVVAGLAALEELVEHDVATHRRAVAMLHVVTLLLVLTAAALRAPLRAEGTVPRAAISALIACLVVFGLQALLAWLPSVRRVLRPAPAELEPAP